MAQMTDLFAGGVTKLTSGAALGNSLVVRAVPALFYGCDGRNTDTSNPAYIWICDTNAVANITAANAVHIVAVGPNSATSPGNGNFGYLAAIFGEYFTTGIVIAGSSTDFPNFTVLSTNKLFISCASALEYGQY